MSVAVGRLPVAIAPVQSRTQPVGAIRVGTAAAAPNRVARLRTRPGGAGSCRTGGPAAGRPAAPTFAARPNAASAAARQRRRLEAARGHAPASRRSCARELIDRLHSIAGVHLPRWPAQHQAVRILLQFDQVIGQPPEADQSNVDRTLFVG